MIDIIELQMLPEEKPANEPELELFECTPLSCLYDFTGGL